LAFGGGELAGDALFGDGEERGGVLAAGARVSDADRAGIVEGGDPGDGGSEGDGVDGVWVVEDA
jgi:hypothetical protein